MNTLLCGDFGHEERRAWLQALGAACPHVAWLDESQARQAPASVRAAVVARPAPGSLQGYPQLALIQSLWAGVDALLADPTVPVDVPLARMVDPAMNEAMAETALWATLSLQRRFFDYLAQQRRGVWRTLPQVRADAWHVLVLGLGQMGLAAARRLAAHGYRVAGWARSPRELPAGVAGAFGASALAPALAAADVVVNLLPLTASTRGLLGASLFGHLRDGTALVNLGRGAHLVEDDLMAALERGRIGHAVLDVFATEPLPAAHPFWTHPKVTVLPHVAAATDPTSAAAVVARNLEALARGDPLQHLVDRRQGY